MYLGGNTYYIFGDTFCFDDKGDFVGARNNTVAYVPDPTNEPAKSRYLESQPYVSLCVPHTESEQAYENDPEHKKNNDRVTCWSFGGIIEDHPGSNHGWLFFDKMLTVKFACTESLLVFFTDTPLFSMAELLATTLAWAFAESVCQMTST